MTLSGLPQPGLLVSSEEVVAGIVDTTGPSIVKGSGFSVSKNTTGDVTITFTTAFSDTPRIIATPGNSPSEVRISSQSTTSVRLQAYASGGGATEATLFNFIAYIPSSGKTRVPREFGLVTALPTSPTPQTGDMCTYVDSLSSPTYRFRFQYNGSSSSSYKWECIGGTPIASQVATQQSTNGGTFTQTGFTAQDLVLPLAGDWDVFISYQFLSDAAGGGGVMSYQIGASGAADADGVIGISHSANVDGPTVARVKRQTGLSAVTLSARWRMIIGGTANFKERRFSAMPVRVG